MFQRVPITDEASLADSAARLERHVVATGRHLDQYSPTLAHAADGRLFMAFAEGDHQTFARYPLLAAPELLQPEHSHQAKISRALAETRRLHLATTPYQFQHLPGPDATMVVGMAMPMGFLAYEGLDVNWDGGAWNVAEGFIRASLHHPKNPDFHIPASEHPAGVKVIFLAYAVAFEFDANGDEVIRITNARLKTSDTAAFAPATTLATNDSETWTTGELASPVAYCIQPDQEQGPVTLRIGHGAIPYSRQYARPISIGGVIAP